MNQTEYFLFNVLYWVAGLVFMKHERQEKFSLRVSISLAVAAILTFCMAVLYGYTGENGRYALILINGVAMILFIKWNWKVFWSVALYSTIWFRMVWWLIVELWQLLRHTYGQRMINMRELMLMVLFFTVPYFLCERTIMRWIPNIGKKHIGPRQLLSAMLLGAVFELLAYMPEIFLRIGGLDRWLVLFLLQMICVFILYLQNELFRKSAMRQELALMELLLKKEKEQYLLSKENIALINQKCHDLKHQIRAIRKSDESDKSRYLKEVEQSIGIYESIVETGNEVLDTILTEKSLYCKEREIIVSCVTDGRLLAFVNVIDLYSLLGNAIDNAIEAVEQLKEPEKRHIDVLIYKQQNFVVVNIVNPLEESLVFEGELPLTTKEDKNVHGFGMRSMKYILKKYEGVLSVTQEDGCFSLKMLLPMPTGACKAD